MFEPVSRITGVAAPLPLANIDTDVIIRIERLTGATREGLGRWAFESLRYLSDGEEDPEFVLNRYGYRGAPILLAGPNFGCGSSREAAATALKDAGVRCVIAERFGDIFYANCFQNGLLPVRLPEATVLRLMEAAAAPQAFTVDLETQVVRSPLGEDIPFLIDRQRRDALLAGVDDIGLTLLDADAIGMWQERDRASRPWIWEIAA